MPRKKRPTRDNQSFKAALLRFVAAVIDFFDDWFDDHWPPDDHWPF